MVSPCHYWGPLVTIPFSSIRFNVALSVYYKYPRYSCVTCVCPTITAALTRLTAARRHTEQLCAARAQCRASTAHLECVCKLVCGVLANIAIMCLF